MALLKSHGALHNRLVFRRRVRILSEHIGALLPRGARVLDVGCGDGSIDASLLAHRGDLIIEGIDVVERPRTHIPVHIFDGKHIPYEGDRFDWVLFIDVLHHTAESDSLLGEAKRVARNGIVVKDHVYGRRWEKQVLRFMDFVGNAPHGVASPAHFRTEKEWTESFSAQGLQRCRLRRSLGLYPRPFSYVFDGSLHFICVLRTADCHE